MSDGTDRISDASTIRGVVVKVACTYCHGRGRVPGGPYRDQGEVIACPLCRDGVISKTIPIEQLRELLRPEKP